MKKITALLLAALMIFVFVGCDNGIEPFPEVTERDEISIPSPTINYPDEEETTPSYSFEKGSLLSNVYTNNWANLKFELSDGWQNGEASEYASYETTANSYCGLAANKQTGATLTQLDIAFEELTGINSTLTVSQYIDTIKPMFETQYSNMGITVEIGEIYNQTIANETYSSFVINLSNLGIQHINVRKLDNYIVLINVTTSDKFTSSTVLNSIRTAR